MAKSVPKKSQSLFKQLTSSKYASIVILMCALLFVFLFYSFAVTEEDFVSKSREAYKKDHVNHQKHDKDFQEKHAELTKNQAEKHAEEYHNDYHVLFIFIKSKDNPKLQEKFKGVFGSMLKHATFKEGEKFHLHFVCDDYGRSFAEEYLSTHIPHPKFILKVHFHSTSTLSEQLIPMTQKLQKTFGQDHPYYEDNIFFLSLVLHKILPDTVHRLVQLDLDLKIMVNIRDLWNEFAYFNQKNIIGLAYENQPVYRHMLWKYRQENPGTTFGNPPASGQPGYNSGVLLLQLDNMRKSYLYNSNLDVNVAQELVKKYHFKGHLGDQDFFTLLSFSFPELFHTLDCTWNRQLCQWWKNKGYAEIFNEYFQCSGDIKIWHGNCDTKIPV